MILSDRSIGHRVHIVEQFEAILPGMNSYRVKFGNGANYAATVIIDFRYYFSHDGKVFHYIHGIVGSNKLPTHDIIIEGYRP